VGIAAAEIIVDGICGTGITRDVDGAYRDIVERINDSGKPVVAIDIPSGVDGNNGALRGIAVRADRTVTFGLPKRGNLIYPGAAMGGRLSVTHISFPPQLIEESGITVVLNRPTALPPRRVDGHKGSYGDVLFVAGAAGYFGAPAFAALSLLRAGAGYARLAAPRSITSALAGIAPEAVFAPQDETPAGSLAAKALDPLLELSGRVDMVVLGPGLSLADKTQHLVRKLTSRIEKPLLVDGDGLTAVAADPDVVRYRAGATILTPHPGEMSRLLGQPVPEILGDPVGAVQRAVEDLGAIVVLKGAHSLIGLPDGSVHINTSGNSGMASAGSGDVLAGTIAAMHGLGLCAEDAARTGVFAHGLAGDLAAEEQGEDGIIARDLVEQLPSAVRLLRDEYATVTANHYDTVELI
jgi:NAD(P)H-hydrate epimerase